MYTSLAIDTNSNLIFARVNNGNLNLILETMAWQHTHAKLQSPSSCDVMCPMVDCFASPNPPRQTKPRAVSISSHFRVSFPNPTYDADPARARLVLVPEHRRKVTNLIRISRPFPFPIVDPQPAPASRQSSPTPDRARDGADPRNAPLQFDRRKLRRPGGDSLVGRA
jgi:hypothetical protein